MAVSWKEVAGFRAIRLVGDKALLRALQELKYSVRNVIMRRAVRKAMPIVNKAAKARAPVSSASEAYPFAAGSLKKSIGWKVVRRRDGEITGICGPRVKPSFIQASAGKDGKPLFRNPAHYAHLVEFGHGGPHPAAARPFLRLAMDNSRQAMYAKIRDETKILIKKEAEKLASKK